MFVKAALKCQSNNSNIYVTLFFVDYLLPCKLRFYWFFICWVNWYLILDILNYVMRLCLLFKVVENMEEFILPAKQPGWIQDTSSKQPSVISMSIPFSKPWTAISISPTFAPSRDHSWTFMGRNISHSLSLQAYGMLVRIQPILVQLMGLEVHKHFNAVSFSSYSLSLISMTHSSSLRLLFLVFWPEKTGSVCPLYHVLPTVYLGPRPKSGCTEKEEYVVAFPLPSWDHRSSHPRGRTSFSEF